MHVNGLLIGKKDNLIITQHGAFSCKFAYIAEIDIHGSAIHSHQCPETADLHSLHDGSPGTVANAGYWRPPPQPPNGGLTSSFCLEVLFWRFLDSSVRKYLLVVVILLLPSVSCRISTSCMGASSLNLASSHPDKELSVFVGNV